MGDSVMIPSNAPAGMDFILNPKCPTGTQPISGGYFLSFGDFTDYGRFAIAISDRFENGWRVVAWTTAQLSPDSGGFDVYVYCVPS
jgi:hypothetical protein